MQTVQISVIEAKHSLCVYGCFFLGFFFFWLYWDSEDSGRFENKASNEMLEKL